MKNKNVITWIILVVIAIGVFALFGGENSAVLPVKSQVESGSVLTANRTLFDFGTISMKDGTVDTEFIVVNESKESLRIDSIVTSCMCTTAYIIESGRKRGPYGMPGHGDLVPKANKILAPGEEIKIQVVFDPAAHGPAGVGFADRYIYLVDENGGALELELRAMVTM